MAKRQLTVALMGAGGNMRNAHLPRIQRDGATTIVAVADPVASQAQLLIDKTGYEIPHYADWRAMLDEVAADAVLISTPHRDHFPQAQASLAKGMHVLVEKPLVIQPDHAEHLLALAKAQERALVVAYQRHWMPHFVYARQLVREGVLGEIRGVVAYVTQHWVGVGGWRLEPDLAGGGMFMDTGSHLVAALLWVSGLHPEQVTATFDNAGLAVDVNGGLHMRFAGGAIGTLATIGNASRHDERLVLSGSEGSLVLHLHQWQVRSMLVNDKPVDLPTRIQSSSPDEALFGLVREGLENYEPPAFALQVARLTEAAYRSRETGRPAAVRKVG